MRLVTGIVAPSTLDDVKNALERVGVQVMTGGRGAEAL